MGETRTNLKKGSAAERLTDYLNYILGVVYRVNLFLYTCYLPGPLSCHHSRVACVVCVSKIIVGLLETSRTLLWQGCRGRSWERNCDSFVTSVNSRFV